MVYIETRFIVSKLIDCFFFIYDISGITLHICCEGLRFIWDSLCFIKFYQKIKILLLEICIILRCFGAGHP